MLIRRQLSKLPAGDPILRAQHVIIDLLERGQRDLAWYSATLQHPFPMLCDLKTLARWACACIAQQDVEAHAPADLASRIAELRGVTDWPYGPYWSGSRRDLTMDEPALGMVIAVKVVTAPCLPAARSLLHDLMRTATQVAGFRDGVPVPVGLSSAMRALCDSAYAPIRADRKLL